MELEKTIRRAAASPRRRRDERLRRLDRRHNAFVRHAIDAESCAGRGARPFDGDGTHRTWLARGTPESCMRPAAVAVPVSRVSLIQPSYSALSELFGEAAPARRAQFPRPALLRVAGLSGEKIGRFRRGRGLGLLLLLLLLLLLWLARRLRRLRLRRLRRPRPREHDIRALQRQRITADAHAHAPPLSEIRGRLHDDAAAPVVSRVR